MTHNTAETFDVCFYRQDARGAYAGISVTQGRFWVLHRWGKIWNEARSTPQCHISPTWCRYKGMRPQKMTF